MVTRPPWLKKKEYIYIYTREKKRKKVNQPILTTLIKIPNTLTWKSQKIRCNKNKNNTAFTPIKLSFFNLYCTFCRLIMLYIKRERGLICKWSMIYHFIYLCIVWKPTWKSSYMDHFIFRFLWLQRCSLLKISHICRWK